MRITGLTGQSGSGKSTVSACFAENGFYIIDCDMVARKVMEKGHPCLDETVDLLGNDILLSDGTLNRRKTAEIIFSDKSKLEAFDTLVYKYINAEIDKEISECGAENILLDAPTLFEAGADKKCDIIVSVTAPTEICTERIMTRDGLDRKSAEKRLANQHSADFFSERSDYLICNDGTKEKMTQTTCEIIRQIMEN